ncbi:hypothetical protein PF010_g7227 [Phytophthora fragariae]|nr:hypothetical protein PF010_g7227 [Phytophthora fragariae]
MVAEECRGATAWEQKILAALRTYKQLNGHLLVLRSFVVPSGDARWPSVTWGYKLGTAVSDLRTRSKGKARLSTEMEEELDKLGFVYDAYQFRWDRIVLPALREFHRVNGHADVPRSFIVPSGDQAWPKLTWGYRLGNIAGHIRHQEVYSTQVTMSKEELDRMGFCRGMSIAERDWTEKILPSIRVYRQAFGNCIIPKLFIVPSCPPWPEKAWGMPLGVAVSDIRFGSTYVDQVARDKDVLDSLSSRAWKKRVAPLLDLFVELHGEKEVPHDFVIPSETPWDEKMWGVRLGLIVARNPQFTPRKC